MRDSTFGDHLEMAVKGSSLVGTFPNRTTHKRSWSHVDINNSSVTNSDSQTERSETWPYGSKCVVFKDLLFCPVSTGAV